MNVLSKIKRVPGWAYLCAICVSLYGTGAGMTHGYFDKLGDYLFKQTEARLLPAVPEKPSSAVQNAQAVPSRSPDQGSPRAFIKMSDHSGLEGLSIVLNGKTQIGVLNDGIEGASFKDVRVVGARNAGFANIDSKNLTFDGVEVNMGPPRRN